MSITCCLAHGSHKPSRFIRRTVDLDHHAVDTHRKMRALDRDLIVYSLSGGDFSGRQASVRLAHVIYPLRTMLPTTTR